MPRSLYSATNEELIFTCDFLFDFTISLKSSASFLLMAYYSHIVGSSARKSFMSSCEHKSYSIYSLISFFVYPALSMIFLKVEFSYLSPTTLSTVIPQMLYHCECFFFVVVCFINNLRLKRLVNTLPPDSTASITLRKCIATNTLLLIVILLDGVSLFSINIDILTKENRLVPDKLGTDMLTAIFNLGFCLCSPLEVSILFPYEETFRKTAGGSNGNSCNTNAAEAEQLVSRSHNASANSSNNNNNARSLYVSNNATVGSTMRLTSGGGGTGGTVLMTAVGSGADTKLQLSDREGGAAAAGAANAAGSAGGSGSGSPQQGERRPVPLRFGPSRGAPRRSVPSSNGGGVSVVHTSIPLTPRRYEAIVAHHPVAKRQDSDDYQVRCCAVWCGAFRNRARGGART